MPYRIRLRVFGLLNILLALVWSYAAWRVFKHILHLEFVGMLMGEIQFVGADGATPITPNSTSTK